MSNPDTNKNHIAFGYRVWGSIERCFLSSGQFYVSASGWRKRGKRGAQAYAKSCDRTGMRCKSSTEAGITVRITTRRKALQNYEPVL